MNQNTNLQVVGIGYAAANLLLWPMNYFFPDFMAVAPELVVDHLDILLAGVFAYFIKEDTVVV